MRHPDLSKDLNYLQSVSSDVLEASQEPLVKTPSPYRQEGWGDSPASDRVISSLHAVQTNLCHQRWLIPVARKNTSEEQMYCFWTVTGTDPGTHITRAPESTKQLRFFKNCLGEKPLTLSSSLLQLASSNSLLH